jgi:hypothetical protein
VIRLRGNTGNQCVGSLLQSVGNQKFQLSGFVATAAESQKIISFNIPSCHNGWTFTNSG